MKYTTLEEKKIYFDKIKETRKANKNKLLLKVVYDLISNFYNNEDYIKDLLIESLSKRTQKKLKEILYEN